MPAAKPAGPASRSKRLHDFGALRIKEMDEAGIDIQVLSHGAPSTQKLPADTAAALTRRVNDRLPRIVAEQPDALRRFRRAADRGAGGRRRRARAHRQGTRLQGRDAARPRQRRIPRRQEVLADLCARRSARRADLFPSVAAERRRDRGSTTRTTSRISRWWRAPAWGYTVETATTAIRLVLSGVFEKHPKLKIILGHLGETLPFLVWRIDQALARPGQKSMSFRDIFCSNFYITTSGNFSNPALLCCVMEMGVDHILFAVDWPFVAEPAGDRMDGNRAAVRRGQGQDPLRQRQAAVEVVAVCYMTARPRESGGPALKSGLPLRGNERKQGRCVLKHSHQHPSPPGLTRWSMLNRRIRLSMNLFHSPPHGLPGQARQ